MHGVGRGYPSCPLTNGLFRGGGGSPPPPPAETVSRVPLADGTSHKFGVLQVLGLSVTRFGGERYMSAERVRRHRERKRVLDEAALDARRYAEWCGTFTPAVIEERVQRARNYAGKLFDGLIGRSC